MLPAEAYTDDAVLAWERRHLFAGSWTCLGRRVDLFPPDGNLTQRAVMVGDIACLLVRDKDGLRMFANTCRHRGHELLPEDGARRPSGPSAAPTTRGPTTCAGR